MPRHRISLLCAVLRQVRHASPPADKRKHRKPKGARPIGLRGKPKDWIRAMTNIAMGKTAAPSGGAMTSEQKMVILASSLGTVFEWYDFYIYGTLATFLAKYFFSTEIAANVRFIFTLLAFAAGFAVRPFGALIFGRLGDLIGRKYTFLI